MNPLQGVRSGTRAQIVSRTYITLGALAIAWGAWYYQKGQTEWGAIQARLAPVSARVLSLEEQLSDRYTGRDIARNPALLISIEE